MIGWLMERNPETGQVTYRREMQEWNAEKGHFDIVVAGEITADEQAWRELAAILVGDYGLPPMRGR